MVVALVDMRSPADAGRLADLAREIDARVDLVAAASGAVRLPDGVLEKGQELVARHEAAAGPERPAAAPPAPGPASPPSTCAGRAGCPTGAGTASPRTSGPGWSARCPPWPPSSPRRYPATPAASSSSARRS